MKLLLVGATTRPHGLSGALVLLAYHPESDLWSAPGQCTLYVLPAGIPYKDAQGRPRDLIEVDGAHAFEHWSVERPAPDRWTLQLNGVTGRTGAEAWTKRLLAIQSSEVDPPGTDEFLFYEVPGWQVFTTGGELVGEVVRAIHTHVDLFEVRPVGGGPTFFIPVIAEVVKTIDRHEGRIVIDPIEGLVP